MEWAILIGIVLYGVVAHFVGRYIAWRWGGVDVVRKLSPKTWAWAMAAALWPVSLPLMRLRDPHNNRRWRPRAIQRDQTAQSVNGYTE